MELGGKSPLIVFGDADLDSAVSGAILGNFYSSGQVCSNGTRVFVERGLRPRFAERLVERLAGVVMGDPLDEAVNFGPMASERQLEIVAGYIRKGIEEGATLIHGGHRANRPGFFIEPTVFTGVTDGMTIAREEIFGPVMSILDFDAEDEVIARANATPFGLSAGVFTRDLARAHRVAARVQAGTSWINTYNLSPVEAPFGGTKMSGVGRENSKAAIEHYTELRSVYVAAGACQAAY
jgi:betaine-aldehyde dehydrogenase